LNTIDYPDASGTGHQRQPDGGSAHGRAGRVPGRPLTLFWKLIIALSAAVGVGTCAVLGFVYVQFFMPVPGTVDVLARQLTKQDAVLAIQDEEGEARIGESRFLASYESVTYYAAPGKTSGVACLVLKAAWDDRLSYGEACNAVGDGRDPLVDIPDVDGSDVLFVPDQFDHRRMEQEGWVTLHRNLLVHPQGGAPLPATPPHFTGASAARTNQSGAIELIRGTRR